MTIDIYTASNEIIGSDYIPQAIDYKSFATPKAIDAVVDAIGYGIHFACDGRG